MSARHLLFRAAVFICSAQSLFAADAAVSPPQPEVATIPTPIADGSPTLPPPKQELPEFSVRSVIMQSVEAEGRTDIPGLPPTKATVKATVQVVDDPNLPEPPPPLPPLDINDPAVQARISEFRARFGEQNRPLIAMVSANWYVREQVSRITWWVDGEQMTCVSRLNMLHFGGFGEFKVGERRYALVMGIGSEDTGRLEQLAHSKGRDFVQPNLAEIPEGQDFVVTKGDANDAQKMQLIRDLHTLGAAEGPRMEAAYLAREQARTQREAYLRAHPPRPEDIVIRVWQRNQLPSAQDGSESEGGAR